MRLFCTKENLSHSLKITLAICVCVVFLFLGVFSSPFTNVHHITILRLVRSGIFLWGSLLVTDIVFLHDRKIYIKNVGKL